MDALRLAAWIVATSMFGLGMISCFCRVYSRGFIIQTGFGWDDWIMVGIIFLNIGQQYIVYNFMHFSSQINSILSSGESLTYDIYSSLLNYLFAEEILYTILHWGLKMCFLFFFLRLSQSITFRRTVFFTMGLNSVLMGTTFIMLCTQCLPLDVFFHPWLYEDSESHCMNSKVIYYIPSSFFTFLDVCILVLPIPTLWSLQVSFNKRLALLSVISCGGVGLIISIIRMITLHGFSADMDFVPLINRTVLMTSLEINAYILSANMPSLKAIWSKHITRSLVRSRGYKNGYTSGTRGPSRLTNPIQKSSHHVVEILASGTKSRNSDDHEMNTINSGSGDTRSDSQEQLFHNGQPLPHAIVVTHELGVGIERASQSPEFNREYYDFKEGTTKGVLGRRPSKILRGT